MKDNEKRPPHDPHDHHDLHDPHDPPPGDPECDRRKKKKEKKHRRRRGPVLFLILIIIILLALIYFFRDGLGLGGNGKGTGSGDSTSETASDPSQSSEISSEQNADVTEIRIEQEAIYIGSELCKDENDLKEKITAAGKGKKYVLIHDTAIKETYDKVKPMLLELKDALELEIDFNE